MAVRFFKSLFCLGDEDELMKRTKDTLVFATGSVGVFSAVGYIFTPINIMLGGYSERDVSIAPLVYVAIVSVLFAIFVGATTLFKQKKEEETIFAKKAAQRRKEQLRTLAMRKTEMLVYAVISTLLALVCLLSKIMTVVFDDTYVDIPEYKLVGYKLLTDTESLAPKGERTLAFLVFVVFCVLVTVLFITVVSYISRSALYSRISVAAVVTGAVSTLLIGLIGQYYRIVQELNIETLLMIVEEYDPDYVEYAEELVEYSVKSSSILFFFGALAILALFFLRRPYTKAAEIEKVLDAEEAAKFARSIDINSFSSNGEGEGENEVFAEPVDMEDHDPCPAFSEIDSKLPSYSDELEAKKQSLFEDLTLPRLVDFVVHYARNSRNHLFYTEESIAAFFAGLGTTKLTILQGMSGTGKTSLPKIVAEALNSVCDIVEVESSWRDKNELLGYYNEFNKVYVPKKFVQMLYRAKLNPERITFIVLDEMNLSRIEYYFSDFLSLMENDPDKRELKLLNVPLFRVHNRMRFSYKGLVDGHTIKIPNNVWFVGTANRDESTYDISDKVYDRAHTMNFDKRANKVQYYNEPLGARYISPEALNALFEEAKEKVNFSLDQYPVIAEVEKLLAPYNISFGNRVATQMETFVKIYASCFSVNDAVIHDALETILLSKVVRKLELKTIDDKETLASEFEKLRLMRCAEFISSIRED